MLGRAEPIVAAVALRLLQELIRISKLPSYDRLLRTPLKSPSQLLDSRTCGQNPMVYMTQPVYFARTLEFLVSVRYRNNWFRLPPPFAWTLR
jgi:hypothetical protein